VFGWDTNWHFVFKQHFSILLFTVFYALVALCCAPGP